MVFDDLSMEGLGGAVVFAGLAAIMMFRSPFGIDWGNVPVFARVIVVVLTAPLAYFIVSRMLD